MYDIYRIVEVLWAIDFDNPPVSAKADAMFCLVNLSLLVIKRREGNSDGFRVSFIIPIPALVSNLVLISFASKESHLLVATFTDLGFLLVLVRKAFMKQKCYLLPVT